MVGAPQRRRAIELLEHRNDHPGRVVDRRRVAATVIGHQQFFRFFGTGQETPEGAVGAVIEQPAEAQQHMLGAGCAHALLDAPQGLTTQAQRHRLVFFAVGGRPRAVEHPIARGLQQNDVVMLAQFGQTLDCTLLPGQTRFADRLRLEPVEVVGEVDQRVRAGVVEQLRQARGIPAVLRWAGGEETDVFLRTEANQRLPKGISAAQ
ncbi:hypothetical protein D3C84_867790 [compost metagenome]